MELSVAAVLLSCLAPALASTMDEIHDYESLRIGGMIFAVILFLMGIFLIIGRKCQCRGNKSKPVGLDPEAARGSMAS
ncbi:FXYD domain-containing ion transport regulator 6-like isoform X4 [Myxocyprinus asiaticus]|uniref:FXYD domain-containing ion transport regulator 6-like isoform X4 n=1 Tax=Myxocyprinus asiaticus TaxID=70543 RepID=UPI0022229EBC|nr:FXYD domain-containing ion transport regulator 6-like isoform X4 [Myxocyprinus asiaticus]XP_051576289.1 FXYD domain-containing ion transport regulator 6-like isoform X4 [Myxocyprinus asiaticus]